MDSRADTGSAAYVVERELGDAGVELHQQRERLSDTSRCTEHGDLDELQHGGVSAIP